MAPQLLDCSLVYFLIFPILGLLLSSLVYLRFLAWYRLRHVDGPWLASLSYLWLLWATFKQGQGISFTKLDQEYGSLVRIGPKDLITSDPEIIRRMSAARSRYQHPYYASLFSMTDTGEHAKVRARMSSGYRNKDSTTIEGVDEQLAEFVALIRRKYLSSDHELRSLDLASKITFLAIDVLSKVAYGRAFGYLRTDSDVHGHVESMETAINSLSVLLDIPWLAGPVFSRAFLGLFGPKPTDESGRGKMMGIAQAITSEERFGPDAKDRQDMLGSFIKHGFTRRQCETEIPFQIIAGSATIATAICGTMLSLLSLPRVYFKLREEIDGAIASGLLSSPIKEDEAMKLEYLQAVIYEGLRINTPLSSLLSKEVPPEGDTIDGKFIPGGTRIGHNNFAMHRSTAIFGRDAHVFRPERWLDIDAEKHCRMTETVELIFGYGQFGCLGKNIAFVELNKVYVELLRYFDFQLIDPKKPIHSVDRNIFLQKEMWVRVTERA
ncbi:cytochrome P450 [Daldinia vernicosa]|uniref:cytochrome P450 n=1 Tax=Daldinia vernicosa TaxID=114800 RepID=UPI002007BE4B|nr:cytochrome P450 [Daldinia vernicosa]KAI0851282.1 cytochrome P450 [Daldinia vernicosa]